MLRYSFIAIVVLLLAVSARADIDKKDNVGEIGVAIEKSLTDQSKKPALSPQQRAVKTYFEQRVFPLVPSAMQALKANPTCPGPCCPSTEKKGFNDPANHAAQIAYQLLKKQYCVPKP